MNTSVDDSQLMQGGPGQGAQEQTAKNDNQVATGSDQTVTHQKKIYVGTKQFDTEADLIKYTQALESKFIDTQVNQRVETITQNVNKPKPSELMFQDPDAFYEMTKQDAIAEIESRLNKEKNETRIWGEFWKENKDLKAHEDLVQMAVSHRREEYKDLQVPEALSKIAVEVRNKISSIKGSPSGGKEVPSGAAVVAGSGSINNTSPVAAKAEPRTFVDQLRQRQKKGKS